MSGLRDVCGQIPGLGRGDRFQDGSTVFFDGAKDMFKYYFDLKKYNPSKKQTDIEALQVTDYYDLTRDQWIRGILRHRKRCLRTHGPGADSLCQGRGCQRVPERPQGEIDCEIQRGDSRPHKNPGLNSMRKAKKFFFFILFQGIIPDLPLGSFLLPNPRRSILA